MQKLTFLLCVLLWPGLAMAGWDEARAAYQKGDFKTAAREMKTLAEKGDVKAQVNLGAMYADGQGVPRNYKTAIKWYLRAAKQGDTKAQVNLGEMYMTGQGVRQDYVQALKWNLVAAQAGDADAVRYREQLAAEMSAAQVEDAKRQSRAWFAEQSKRRAQPSR